MMSNSSKTEMFARRVMEDLSVEVLQKLFEQELSSVDRGGAWRKTLRAMAKAPSEDRPLLLSELLSEDHVALHEPSALTVLQLYLDSPETQLQAFDLLAHDVPEWGQADGTLTLTKSLRAFLKTALESELLSDDARAMFMDIVEAQLGPVH